MNVFEKCPVCGEFAFVEPEYSNAFRKVYRCHEGHVFKKNIRADSLMENKLWERIPKRTETLITCCPLPQVK